MESRLRKEQFIDSLQNAQFTNRERATISAIASKPNQEISQAQLLETLNEDSDVIQANSAMGNVGKRIATYLKFQVDTTPYNGAPSLFSVISLWDEEKRVWRLHDEMIEALREMGQIQTVSSPSPANPSPKEKPPGRGHYEIRPIKRDSLLVKKIKTLYDYRCQIKDCNYTLRLPNGTQYAEVHHIKPLGGHNGSDLMENVICVCANHHKELDYGARKLHLSDIFLDPTHPIDQGNLDYHNACIFEHVVMEESDNLTNESPSALSDDYLANVIRVAGIRGGQTLLAKKLSEITGKNILRQAIQSWTRENNRIAPSLGMGLALAKAAEAVAQELGNQT